MRRTMPIRTAWLLVLTLLVAVMALSNPAAAQQQQRRPNILVIMGDDVGWFNIGAYHRGMMSGKTPNLDKLHRESVSRNDDVVASYSSRGPNPAESTGDTFWRKPDVVAPGSRIAGACASTSPGDQHGEGLDCDMTGTSMATPHVAGVAALLTAQGRSVQRVFDVLKSTARTPGLGTRGKDRGQPAREQPRAERDQRGDDAREREPHREPLALGREEGVGDQDQEDRAGHDQLRQDRVVIDRLVHRLAAIAGSSLTRRAA